MKDIIAVSMWFGGAAALAFLVQYVVTKYVGYNPWVTQRWEIEPQPWGRGELRRIDSLVRWRRSASIALYIMAVVAFAVLMPFVE
jgi:hypothetical protein